jgi:hypothetical protein
MLRQEKQLHHGQALNRTAPENNARFTKKNRCTFASFADFASRPSRLKAFPARYRPAGAPCQAVDTL